MGVKIYNENGQKIGAFSDFFVEYEHIYPLVLAIQYQYKNQYYYVEWDSIKYLSYKKIVVFQDSTIRKGPFYPKVFNKKVLNGMLSHKYENTTVDYPSIGKLILDRQIVDVSGKKVVRVNDINLIKVGKYLRVTHAGVGFRSMIRRLGFESPIDTLIRSIRPKSPYLNSDVLISWKYVHAIPDKSIQKNVKLNVRTDAELQGLHPADLADILEDLDNYGRKQIFEKLDPETAAATLSEIEEDLQVDLIKTEPPEHVAEIIENMGTDEAADLLNDLSETEANDIISKIKDDETQEEIQELLEYEEDSAGGLMSTEVFFVRPDMRKSEILGHIQENYEEFESIYDIYIVDQDRKLIGACSLKDLLIQIEDAPISDIMIKDDIKFLNPDMHWRETAQYMSKYNLINVPITDENKKLLGIVSIDDILPLTLK